MELLRVLASSITRFNDKRSVQLGLDALRQLCLTRDSDEKPGAIPAAAAQWVISETEKTLKGSSQGLVRIRAYAK